jgi:hypothetical protein
MCVLHQVAWSNIQSELGRQFSESLLHYVVAATGVVDPAEIQRDILEVRLLNISDSAVEDTTSRAESSSYLRTWCYELYLYTRGRSDTYKI